MNISELSDKELSDFIFDNFAPDENSDISEVPEPARSVIAVYTAQGIIDNGGLYYFFEYDYPNENAYNVIMDSYINVGHSEVADAIAKVLSLFPDSTPHASESKRDQFLQKYFGDDLHPTVEWAENIIDGASQDVYQNAIKYFRAKNT